MNGNIRKYLLELIPPEHSWKIILLESWQNIVGDLKNSITIEQIKEDVLFLGVVHPAWAQEILALTPVLKEKINAYLEKEYIKTIRIKLKQTKKNNIPNHLQDWKPQQTTRATLTTGEIDNLNKLKDIDLRTAMQDFYLKCKSKK